MKWFRRVPPAPPEPKDVRRDNEGWQAGDLAECISDGAWQLPRPGMAYPQFRHVYRVREVRDTITFDGRYRMIGLVLKGLGPFDVWQCTSFRKLRPAEDEFTKLMRAMKPVKADRPKVTVTYG